MAANAVCVLIQSTRPLFLARRYSESGNKHMQLLGKVNYKNNQRPFVLSAYQNKEDITLISDCQT